MTKLTITRERLQEIAEDGFLKHGESKELARMALAAMDNEPVVQPVMLIDGDISSDDADKLAKIIREFNEEDERPLAKMARIIRENPHPTNECDMPKAQPAPVVPDRMTAIVKDEAEYVEGWNACRAAMLQAGNSPVIPEGYVMVPKEPTERMVIDGFESEPDETFSEPEVWEAFQKMSGCEQAAFRARLCWAAMLAAAPQEVQVVPEKIEQSRKRVDRCDVCTEGARVWCGTCIFNGNFE